MTNSRITPGSTIIVEVLGVQNDQGDYVTNAIVQLTSLTTHAEEEVGLELPVTLDYVEGSDGDYQALLPNDLDIDIHDILTGTFTITVGSAHKTVTELVRVVRGSN